MECIRRFRSCWLNRKDFLCLHDSDDISLLDADEIAILSHEQVISPFIDKDSS
jgi:hypothetical protein